MPPIRRHPREHIHRALAPNRNALNIQRAPDALQKLFLKPTTPKSKSSRKLTAIRDEVAYPRTRVRRCAPQVPSGTQLQRAHLPPQAPPQEHLALARNRARVNAAPAGFDRAFGEEAVSYLQPVQEALPSRNRYVDAAIHRCCNRLSLQRVRIPVASPADVVRYTHIQYGFNAYFDHRLPIVWMNDENTFGVDSIGPGSHGAAWSFSKASPELYRARPFHLFNNPSRADEWKQRTWQYCGKYYAHKTGEMMSVEGWRGLPPSVRQAAAHIRAISNASARASTPDVEAAYAKFESGEYRAELVILQYCGYPAFSFTDELHQSVAECLRAANPNNNPPKKPALEKVLQCPELAECYQRIQERMKTPRVRQV